MNLLLDTHIILWWLEGDERLPQLHRNLIENRDNVCYISSASIWEISIKRRLGKLVIPDGFQKILKEQGFVELPITWRHSLKVQDLPDIHSDPFDRMLVAQALSEDLQLLTVDSRILSYPVRSC